MAMEPTLDGLYKSVYSNKIEDLIPRPMVLQQKIGFDTGKRIGKDYNQPVILSDEAGATYNTQSVASSAAFSLNDAIGSVEQNAVIASSEIVMRSWLSYQQAARATSGGEAAFTSATELQVQNNLKSCRKRVELSLMYGGAGSTAEGLATTASSSNVSGTVTNVTITAGSWASGIWSGLKNATVQFYDSSNVLVSTGADSIFSITSIAAATRVIKFTGTSTGITALDSAIGGGACRVFFNGAYNEEAVGLVQIAKNTGSLFGIDAALYDLWAGNSVTLSGAPTMGKFLGGLAPAVGRGLDEDGILLVSPATWNDLNTNEAALRVYDSSWKKSEEENGAESICYYGQNGKVEVMPYLYMKNYESLFFVPGQNKRIGSVDVTYEQPGRGGRIFFDIPDKAGYEFRSYTDQAIFCQKPATLVYFSGFTNATA